MAAILVDYENVCATDGLKGIDYLCEKDTLIIFYSQCCEKIRAEYIESIERCGCEFKIRKLVKTGKNALDFYIASECGRISQTGEKQIAIISKDKGFSAVPDYFRVNAETDNISVVIANNIENALMMLNEKDDSARRKVLKEKTQMIDLTAEHARIMENKLFRNKVLVAFVETKGGIDIYQVLKENI